MKTQKQFFLWNCTQYASPKNGSGTQYEGVHPSTM